MEIVSQTFLFKKMKKSLILLFIFKRVNYLKEVEYDDEWKGIWNSTSITEIKGDPTKSISYKITTSIIYEITCY